MTPIQAFDQLLTNDDFKKMYELQTGQNVAKLTQEQLFSTGSMYHCVKITFADNSGELRLTDCGRDITFNNQVYLATGDFIDIQNPQRSKEITNTGMSIKVSNVRSDYITLIQQGKFERANLDIKLVFVNPLKGNVENSFGVFNGEFDASIITIDNSSQEECTNESEFKINSFWAVLDKSARAHCTPGVHKSYAGNETDTFFDHVGKWNSEAIWTSRK